MGSAATSMSTVFSKKIDISPPRVELLDVTEEKGTDRIPDDEMLVKVSFNLKVGELIDSSIMQLYPLTFAKDLISSLMNSESAEEEETVQPEVTYEQPKELRRQSRVLNRSNSSSRQKGREQQKSSASSGFTGGIFRV